MSSQNSNSFENLEDTANLMTASVQEKRGAKVALILAAAIGTLLIIAGFCLILL